MRSILVLNSKGGTGKTTLATNLAAYYALEEYNVALVDYDVQRSALDWLETRTEERPFIHGVDGTRPGVRIPRNMDYVFMDAPAASHGETLVRLLRKAQTCIIPVVPSPIDLNAAVRFLDRLVRLGRVLNRKVRVGTVANRVRENSAGHQELQHFLRSVRLPDRRRLPFVAALRSTQSYVHAAERGLGIWELPHSRVRHDLELWEPLIKWLNSRRSRPN